MKLLLITALLMFVSTACGTNGTAAGNGGGATAPAGSGKSRSVLNAPPKLKRVQNEPKTVRDFFLAFTQDVFYVEGCDEASDPGCRKARAKYLENYLEIDDTKNGYLAAGGDGAQAALRMTIFRKPSGGYIVAVNQFGEIGDDYTFLEYENGRWKDVSKDVIPEYGTRKIYELPRYGTTIKVFAKKIIDTDGVIEMSEKGAKLYDLAWKDGRFSIVR